MNGIQGIPPQGLSYNNQFGGMNGMNGMNTAG